MKAKKPLLSCDSSSCPVSSCLKFLAGAWTHEILWQLSRGPLRFGELKRALGGVSTKVLSDRLKDMEARGVLSRTVLPTSPPQVEYALTPLGREFAPIFAAMVKVAAKLPVAKKSK